MMASFVLKEKKKQWVFFKYNPYIAGEIEVKDSVVYLLWDDGVVILKNEPLNVMGPETLLFHWLGLEQQALVIYRVSSVLIKIQQIQTHTE